MDMPKNRQAFDSFLKEMGLLMTKRDAEINRLKQLVGTELELNAQIRRYKQYLGNDLNNYERQDIHFLHTDFDDKLTERVVKEYIEKSKYQILFELFSLMYMHGTDLSLALEKCNRELMKERTKNIRSPDRLKARAVAFKLNSASTPAYKKKLRSLKHKIIRRVVNSKKVEAEKHDAEQRTEYRKFFRKDRRKARDEAFGKGNRSNSKTPWYKHFITRTDEQKQLQQQYRQKYKTDQTEDQYDEHRPNFTEIPDTYHNPAAQLP